jgi:hypothetical protein
LKWETAVAAKADNKRTHKYVRKTPASKDRPQNKNLSKTGGPGRPRGVQNKVTTLIKEAVVLAAQLEGSDGKGKDGLVGYLRTAARKNRNAFIGLMGRVLPMQVTHTVGHEHTVAVIMKTMTEEEAAASYFETLQHARDGHMAVIDATAREIESDETEG